MKAYLVNRDLDDGYSVQIVFLSEEERAEERAKGFVKLHLKFDKAFDSKRIWIEEMEVVE